MAKLLTYQAEWTGFKFHFKGLSLFFLQYWPFLLGIKTSWTFVIFLWFDVLVVTWKHWGEKWEINCNCFLRSESQESSGAQSSAVKKSFSEVFSLNRTIMASFTYMFTNSFIHPRNFTGNIYHSLYHIIHWKVSQKLLGLRYSFGAIGRKKSLCLFDWQLLRRISHRDGILYLLWARKCQMLSMISAKVILQSSSQFKLGVTRGTV